jgi:hypothetical protein
MDNISGVNDSVNPSNATAFLPCRYSNSATVLAVCTALALINHTAISAFIASLLTVALNQVPSPPSPAALLAALPASSSSSSSSFATMFLGRLVLCIPNQQILQQQLAVAFLL